MTDYRIDFTLLDWESPMTGVRQKVITHHGKKLRLVEIEFRDGVRIFEQGDGVFIPDGEEHKHKARALTAVVRVVFVEDS